MATHRFECEPCGVAFEITRSVHEPVGDTHPCPRCAFTATKDWRNTMPLLIGGEIGEDYMLDPKKPAAVLNTSGSASYDRQLNSEHVKAMRQQAANTKRARKGGKREHGELRHVGSVPATYFRCAQRTSGDQLYWSRDPNKTLKKHGMLFDT